MIGNTLKYMRKKKGLSQEQLAKMANISQQNLSRYEINKRVISFDMIEDIAKLCGYKIYFINEQTKDKFESDEVERKDI